MEEQYVYLIAILTTALVCTLSVGVWLEFRDRSPKQAAVKEPVRYVVSNDQGCFYGGGCFLGFDATLGGAKSFIDFAQAKEAAIHAAVASGQEWYVYKVDTGQPTYIADHVYSADSDLSVRLAKEMKELSAKVDALTPKATPRKRGAK